MVSARDAIRRRQPVERPLDVVALELLVSVSQAILVGILLSLAAQLGGDARAQGLPVPGLLALLGVAVGVGWVWWLVGGSGWVLSAVCFATAILAGALWLLSLSDPTLPRIDPLVGLIALACAVYGLLAGVFLPGPRREHWKGGVSQPRRGLPQTRTTPARFSPPVQRVVDERLTNVTLPKVTLPALRQLSLPSVKLPSRPAPSTPPTPDGEGLAPAPEVAPHTGPAPDVDPHPTPTLAGPAVDRAPGAAGDQIARPVEAAAEPRASASDPAIDSAETAEEPAAPPADPDAPTQPVQGTATAWPRPIEPHGRSAGDDDRDA